MLAPSPLHPFRPFSPRLQPPAAPAYFYFPQCLIFGINRKCFVYVLSGLVHDSLSLCTPPPPFAIPCPLSALLCRACTLHCRGIRPTFLGEKEKANVEKLCFETEELVMVVSCDQRQWWAVPSPPLEEQGLRWVRCAVCAAVRYPLESPGRWSPVLNQTHVLYFSISKDA